MHTIVSRDKNVASKIERIHHWCSVGTGKSQPLGPPFHWATRLADFPIGTVDPRVGIFLTTLNISL